MFTLKCPWDIPSSILVGKRPTNSLVKLKNSLLQSCLSVYLIRSNVDREYFDMFKAKVRFFNATHNIFFSSSALQRTTVAPVMTSAVPGSSLEETISAVEKSKYYASGMNNLTPDNVDLPNRSGVAIG